MSRPVRLTALLACLLAVAPVAVAQTPAIPPSAPALGTFLDTAALRVALTALPPHEDPRRGARILSISVDTTGAPGWPEAALRSVMPAATRDTLVALLRAHLRPIAPRARAWETHVLLETGPQARVEEVVLDVRQAAVQDLGRLTRRLQTTASDLLREDEALAGRELRVRLRIALTAGGFIDSLSVFSSSGNARVDSAAVRLVRETRFVPMLVEGEPLGTRVVLPVRFIFEP